MENETNLKASGRRNEFDELPESDGIDLTAHFARLARNWPWLVSITIAGGILGALIAIALPNMYTATALILPPTKPQSVSMTLMGQMGGLAGVASSFGLKGPNETYLGILRSRTATDDIVSQFGLQQVYSEKTKEDARNRLRDRAGFALGRDSMIRISVGDRDPQRAAVLANAFVGELSKQNNRLAITESAQRRLFFEREVQAAKGALETAESTLKATQERTGVFEVSNQAQVVIGSIARFRAEIAMQEVSLQRLKMGATSQNPEVARQQTELSALRAELSKLEAGNTRQRSGDPIVPLANVPQSGLEYLRALREVKYHDMLFEILSKQYEAAKIDEAKEAPVIQVVDLAIPPERKSGPPRALITIAATVVSAIAGVILIFAFSTGPAKTPPMGG